MQILVNLHVTLSNFEPLLRKFKHFITAVINACRSPLDNSSAFWKSGENFILEELTNPVLVSYNFTENFTVELLWEFSETSKTIPTAVSLGEFIDQSLLKVISLQVNSTGRLIFWRNKESKFLLGTLQSKEMNNKHSQVLLVFRKNPRKWNYGRSSLLKTCTTLIAGISQRICCFDEVFLMALTSTEQLFIERPLHRRFLHNDHLPFFQ